MRVTDHYGINGPVPFLNVDEGRDNRLFLDPSRIRVAAARGDRRAADAERELHSFADAVLHCRTSRSPFDHAKGRELLQHLHEPNETRLGMSAHGVEGRAFGQYLAGQVWDELGASPAARARVLTRIEDLRLFVDGVGDDLISDLTTRVIFCVLVDFTQAMVAKYPALGVGQTTASVDLWDRAASGWQPQMVRLPHTGGEHQLLLVPKHWVFWRMTMNQHAFYNHFGTGTVQAERATYSRDGRRQVPSKKSLKQEFPYIRGLNNEQAAKYKNQGRDLVQEYRQRVDDAHEPLSDTELKRRM